MMIISGISKKDNPCFECKDRKIGCHGKCNLYKNFKERLEELRIKERGYRLYRSSKTIDVYKGGYNTKKSGKKSTMKSIWMANKNQ